MIPKNIGAPKTKQKDWLKEFATPKKQQQIRDMKLGLFELCRAQSCYYVCIVVMSLYRVKPITENTLREKNRKKQPQATKYLCTCILVYRLSLTPLSYTINWKF